MKNFTSDFVLRNNRCLICHLSNIMIYLIEGGDIIKTIHDKLKTYRQMNNMTLDNVAKVIGVNKTTIQRYETGAIPNIPIETVKALSKLYGVSANELLNLTAVESIKDPFLKLLQTLGYECLPTNDEKADKKIKIKSADGAYYEITHNELLELKTELKDFLSYQLFKLNQKK